MTYSIIARDKKTGQLAGAVQSHYFSVASNVIYTWSGIGIVATQAMALRSYGVKGLDLMANGTPATSALKELIETDPKLRTRQVAMIDSKGIVAAHTGDRCIPYSGHHVGEQFSCQGNIMSTTEVWKSMAQAYEENLDLELPERLVAALEAGESSGGDIRGRQSACLVVVSGQPYADPWSGKIMELRIEDHPEPLIELKRLLRLRRAYDAAERGGDLLTSKKYDESLAAHETAVKYAPEIDELLFWEAVSLVVMDRRPKAFQILSELFKKNARWLQLYRNLVTVGTLPADALDGLPTL